MKNTHFTLIFLLFLMGCSTTPTTQRNPSSTSSDQKLSGEFFRTSIPFPSKNEIKEIFTNIQSDNQSLADGIKRGTGGSRRQLDARTLGLKFCLDRGFQNVAVVFWTRDRLTAAHCIKEGVSRSDILRKSYSAGCRALNMNNRSCGRVRSSLNDAYTLEITDLTTEAGEQSVPSSAIE